MMVPKRLADLKGLVDVAAGRKAPSLLIHEVDVLDVFTGTIWKGNIWVDGQWIAYIGEKRPLATAKTVVIEGRGRVAVPGYFDAHGHAELFYNPAVFADYAVTRGATTVFSDGHDMVNTIGLADFENVLKEAKHFALKFLWGIPATYPPYPDVEGPDIFSLQEVKRIFLRHPECIALSEISPFMRVVNGEERILKRLHMAASLGRRSEGHTLGASYDRLNVLAAAGISSCHESVREVDLRNRMRLGLATMVRHSSIRSDLEDLAPLIRELPKDRIILVSDGVFARDLLATGYMDHVVQSAIRFGIKPADAIRMATLNPADYFGLEGEVGSLTPGKIADILLLDHLELASPALVIERGRVAAEKGRLCRETSAFPAVGQKGLFAFDRLSAGDFDVAAPPGGLVPVIDIADKTITKRTDAALPAENGLLKADRDRDIRKVCFSRREKKQFGKGFVRGLGASIGGIASSVAHDIHGLLVLGFDDGDMLFAANRVVEMGGGIVLADEGRILAELRLPYGGIMSDLALSDLANELEGLNRVMKERGSRLDDPLWTTCFLALSSIGELRITISGVYDVKKREIVF